LGSHVIFLKSFSNELFGFKQLFQIVVQPNTNLAILTSQNG